MAESGGEDLGKLRNISTRAGDLGDGPSSFPSFSRLWRGKGRGCGDGIMDGGGGTAAPVSDNEEKYEFPAEEGSWDPLVVFGSGIMMMILNKLDARSVALARLVSLGWLVLASSDIIWAPKCDELWEGKAHIPRISKVEGLPKMVACSLSIMDGKRTRITRDDLCDHVWDFHFTQGAPAYWRDLDPYWQGSGAPPMRRYFHPDGSITADVDDPVWGGHESSYTVVTGLMTDGKIREHYVRINRWPKLTVERRPDWSWVLYNSLYCYTSLPDAHKEAGTGPPFPLFR